jgi:hypothetical protein
MVFFFPNRRIWARILPATSGSTVQVAATSRHDAGFEQELDRLVGDMELALAGRSVS